MKLNLSKFKKVEESPHHAVLQHPSGHRFTIAKSALSPPAREELKNLPIHKADAGLIEDPEEQEAPASSPIAPAAPDPNALQIEAVNPPGASASGPEASSAAPQRQPASTITPDPGYLSGLNQSFGAQEAAARNLYGAMGQQGKAEAAVAHQEAQDLADIQNRALDKMTDISGDMDQVIGDIKNGHIRPNAYFEDKSVPGKISTAIGLLLGGIGGGLTGQENPAMKFLEMQSQRNIDAQRAEMGKNENLLSAYQHQFGNVADATRMAQATNAAIYAAKFREAAAKTSDPIEKQRGEMLANQYEQQRLQLVGPIALKQSLIEKYNQPPTPVAGQPAQATDKHQIDPAKLVPYLVPADQQVKAYDEIGRRSNIAANSQLLMDTFDKAADANTVMRTGAGLLREPAEVKTLKQLMLPNFKSVDGTVRQAAMDESFHNIIPKSGDTDHTVALKKEALRHWMQSESAAPINSGNNINLDNFQKTAVVQPAAVIKNMNGIPYQQVPGGWKRVQ